MGNCSNISNTQTVTLASGTLTSGFCHNSLQTTYEEFTSKTTGELGGNMAAFTAGDDTPASGDQDKLWMKQNASTCLPEGWHWYNGNSSAWEAVSTPLSTVDSGAVGEVLYHNGTNWVVLPAGTDGEFLKSKGGAAPEWGSVVPEEYVAADGTATSTSLTSSDTKVGEVDLTLPSGKTWKWVKVSWMTQLQSNGGLQGEKIKISGTTMSWASTAGVSKGMNNSDDAAYPTFVAEGVPTDNLSASTLTLEVYARTGSNGGGDTTGQRTLYAVGIAQ
jgi:hypothetical protein